MCVCVYRFLFALFVCQIAEVEHVVTEGVELLAHRPLEVSPFNEDEPQMLRHASTREAFVRLVHYYLLLAEVSKRVALPAPHPLVNNMPNTFGISKVCCVRLCWLVFVKNIPNTFGIRKLCWLVVCCLVLCFVVLL